MGVLWAMAEADLKQNHPAREDSPKFQTWDDHSRL